MGRRTVFIAVIVILLLGAAGAVAAQEADGDVTAEQSEAGAELSFGEEMSIAVAAQQNEVRNTVENEAFGIAFDRNPEDAVERRSEALRERLNRAEERRAELNESLERGEISERRYNANMARLAVEGEGVNRSADHVLRRAEERGVNVENVSELKRNARGLTGPEVAEIARGIAGPPEDRAGPPADVGRERGERPDGVGKGIPDRGGDRDYERGGERDNDRADERGGGETDGSGNGAPF